MPRRWVVRKNRDWMFAAIFSAVTLALLMSLLIFVVFP